MDSGIGVKIKCISEELGMTQPRKSASVMVDGGASLFNFVYLPFCNFLVCSHHRVLNVYWVVSHSAKDEGLVQRPNDKHGIVVI